MQELFFKICNLIANAVTGLKMYVSYCLFN